MEYFGRLQTTAVPKTVVPSPTQPRYSGSQIDTTPRSFSQPNGINFGGGRIVDAQVKDIEKTTPGTVLHTVSSGVTDYYAQGFLEEAEKLYKPSQYAGYIVFLDRTAGIKNTRPEQEYFTLMVSNELQTPITITGWKVFDKNKKTSYSLPKAVKVLGTDGIQKAVPVIVKAGNTIIVSSGRSPIGNSFRINKCSGYRSQFKRFTPTIETDCPSPMDEFVAGGTVPYTDTRCYEIVNRLRQCTAVVKIPPTVSKQCYDFLEKILTERGCVKSHRNDRDFFSSEWRMFLGSQKELWRNRDNILYLLDENNNLVTTLVYR